MHQHTRSVFALAQLFIRRISAPTPLSFLYVLLLATFVNLTACVRNPVTGKRDLILMSKDQEIAMGKESHPSVVATMGLYEDPKLQAFISEKGKAMASISHRPDLPYQFYIVDSPVVNAFAVPGGYVYFTRGIMAHFNNEAEFAGVLGHEIGHITAKHSARQQSTQLFGTAGLILGSVLFDKTGQLTQAASQGLQAALLGYSRAHESQSDELGVEYSSKIGYDAKQMADFFGTLKRIQDASGQAIPEFQSTHPDPGNRQARVNELATNYQQQNPRSYEVDRDSYLRRIEGIIVGEDPKQGFVENDQFYHPELKFQFPIPRGWQHQNAPTQFQMGPKDGKSAMILMLGKGNTPDAAAQDFIESQQLTILQSDKTTINGNPAVVVLSKQQPQQQQGQQQQNPNEQLQIASWFIQYGNTVYGMHGLAQAGSFNQLFDTFRRVASGFRALTDPDKLTRQPDRIRIKAAPQDATFAQAMAALGMPNSRLDQLGTLNGLKNNDRVSRGTLLKTISQ